MKIEFSESEISELVSILSVERDLCRDVLRCLEQEDGSVPIENQFYLKQKQLDRYINKLEFSYE